jgi:prepilin-type N-terminal cleavage/methylation domain-containing protein
MNRRAFTLTELLVAIVILLLVILAVGRVFSTISKVTQVGQANAAYLQSAPAIERQIRRDLERLTREGYLVIRNTRVRNDVNRPSPSSTSIPLLDPTLADDAFVRCDQLLFFTGGIDASRSFTGTDSLAGAGGNQRAVISRVYIGHGFQVRSAPELTDPAGFNDGTLLTPWAWDAPGDPQLDLVKWPPPATNQGRVKGGQPPATDWILARQRVLLADDGGSPLFYNSLSQFGPALRNSTRSIWLDSSTGDWAVDATDDALRNARVDIAALSPAEIRRRVEYTSSGLDRPWTGAANDQRTAMADSLFYPRAELLAPSMLRQDQLLVAPALGHGVVSFAVDWCWDDGVGRQFDSNGNVYWPGVGSPAFLGMFVRPDQDQPWFGLSDSQRGVEPAGAVASPSWGGVFPPIAPAAIERYPLTLSGYPASKVTAYEAAFGYNESTYTVTTFSSGTYTETYNPLDAGYTPFPSALRFTIVIADPQQDGPGRRTLQFTVRLPSR